MKFEDAGKIFESVKSEYKIPDEANISFIEKRIVELEIDSPDEIADSKNELVWVCEYISGSYLFQLTCNMQGEIIRFARTS